MIYVNELGKLEALPRSLWEPLVLMLAPYAPHLAEELWAKAGHQKSLVRAPWPTYDEALCADDTKEIVVQVNGKIRERFSAAAGTAQEELQKTALSLPKVKEWIDCKKIAKVVVVKDKLVNIVVTD
jgi:leucyl-tRNA synthetase